MAFSITVALLVLRTMAKTLACQRKKNKKEH